MSEIIEDPIDDAEVESPGDEVGLTSEEAVDEKKSLLQSMTIYDAMLLVSLFCVGFATLLLLWELREFGNFPSSFPWRTSGF